MIQENFIKLYEDSFKNNWELPALSDYGKNKTLTYADFALEIEKIHLFFDACKLQKGDKIALIGKNNTNWCIVYMATITYGAVIVPILHEFNPNDIHHIINHSQSSLLFCSDSIWDTLEIEKLHDIRGVFSLTDFRTLYQPAGETFEPILSQSESALSLKYPDGFRKENLRYTDLPNEKVVAISYTSGTTGFIKGVMIMGNNLAGIIMCVHRQHLLNRGGKIMSFLPLAHTYGCAFDFLYALYEGCHISLLGKTPSPTTLIKAMEEIRPNLIFAVPLILEKVYRTKVLPALNKKSISFVLRIPFLNRLIYRRFREKLVAVFGGRFIQIILGGAPLNAEVEAFLQKIKFPFTVGYGMTECAPLISYDHHYEFIPTSCGKILSIMEVRVDSSDPYSVVGEIQVRGENVMAGYYRDEEATKNAFTEDGWLKTGDLGTIDSEGHIFIRGRSKDVILGANGQNIYPEEIEAKLNDLPFVIESLVVERNGKLVALVHPDYETADETENSNKDIHAIMEENRKKLNAKVAAYEQIAEIQLYPTIFAKTPKMSIKRYLYHSPS